MMTDPIADMLTRIRNANAIYRFELDIPHSGVKEAIAAKLKETGYIKDYKVTEEDPQNVLTVYLKYGPDGEKVIRSITRESKPGCRIYKKVHELKLVLNGLGTSLVSTSKGILTDAQCREQKVGGELLCTIW